MYHTNINHTNIYLQALPQNPQSTFDVFLDCGKKSKDSLKYSTIILAVNFTSHFCSSCINFHMFEFQQKLLDIEHQTVLRVDSLRHSNEFLCFFSKFVVKPFFYFKPTGILVVCFGNSISSFLQLINKYLTLQVQEQLFLTYSIIFHI